MSLPGLHIALFAKFPRAGEVKTRLIPALGAQGSADLHRALVERTLAVVREASLPLVLYTSGAAPAEFAAWLGDEVALRDQGAGDLGERLARVAAPAILLGADIPDLAASHLRAAADALMDKDAVIGPARDGGYYLLGIRTPLPFLFADMAWGTAAVLAETEARLAGASVPYARLETLSDCDRPQDLACWPELAR